MFDIKDTKAFMDSVHGYINIPRCFVDYLIDTEYFQRLRHIDQTGMRILYPDGKHDRFCHSLGVFYLGNKAVDALLENFSHDNYWQIYSNNDNILFWAKNKILFLIACLLHDIGHAPFSHSVEKEVEENSGRDNFKAELAEKINSKEQNEDIYKVSSADIRSAPHEVTGARLILDKLQPNIEKIFDTLIEASFPKIDNNSVLYAEYYNYNPTIKKDNIEKDICFIARMIMGVYYKNYTPENQIKNCFIELLNGSNFDVDKLDYIIRDTKMSGISNISIDVERLLNSLSIVTKTIYKERDFTSDGNSLANVTVHTIENKVNNGPVYITGSYRGVFVFKKGTKIKIANGSKFVSLTGTNGDANIKYSADPAKFSADTELIRNGNPIGVSVDNTKHLAEADNGGAFNCIMKQASVCCDNGFDFIAEDAVKLRINGKCDMEIKGTFYTTDSVSFFGDAALKGVISEVTILEDLIKDSLPTPNCYNQFSIGFKKQAINIIANVLEARDYLYLWCYAHHKVIYYANFLIPAVAHELFKGHNVKYMPWKIEYKDIQYIDDAYFWTCIKHYSYEQPEGSPLKMMCIELLTRKYRKSLYKSLAEYDLLFEEFSDKQKSDIHSFFSRIVRNDRPCVGRSNSGGYTAGYIADDFLQKLKDANEGIENVVDLIFVDASYTQKNTNAHNTFVFINDEVVSVDKISLLVNRMAISHSSTGHYFYLYYNTKTSDVGALKSENYELKRAIRDYFKRNDEWNIEAR